jgi:hypothetical protein
MVLFDILQKEVLDFPVLPYFYWLRDVRLDSFKVILKISYILVSCDGWRWSVDGLHEQQCSTSRLLMWDTVDSAMVWTISKDYMRMDEGYNYIMTRATTTTIPNDYGCDYMVVRVATTWW